MQRLRDHSVTSDAHETHRPASPAADPLSFTASLKARGVLGAEEAEILAERERRLEPVTFAGMNGVLFREVIDGFLIREW
jgi:hypothetical protein